MIIRVRLFLHYLIKIGVGALRIENFVAIHDGDEVLGVGEIDDVISPSMIREYSGGMDQGRIL